MRYNVIILVVAAVLLSVAFGAQRLHGTVHTRLFSQGVTHIEAFINSAEPEHQPSVIEALRANEAWVREATGINSDIPLEALWEKEEQNAVLASFTPQSWNAWWSTVLHSPWTHGIAAFIFIMVPWIGFCLYSDNSRHRIVDLPYHRRVWPWIFVPLTAVAVIPIPCYIISAFRLRGDVLKARRLGIVQDATHVSAIPSISLCPHFPQGERIVQDATHVSAIPSISLCPHFPQGEREAEEMWRTVMDSLRIRIWTQDLSYVEERLQSLRTTLRRCGDDIRSIQGEVNEVTARRNALIAAKPNEISEHDHAQSKRAFARLLQQKFKELSVTESEVTATKPLFVRKESRVFYVGTYKVTLFFSPTANPPGEVRCVHTGRLNGSLEPYGDGAVGGGAWGFCFGGRNGFLETLIKHGDYAAAFSVAFEAIATFDQYDADSLAAVFAEKAVEDIDTRKENTDDGDRVV